MTELTRNFLIFDPHSSSVFTLLFSIRLNAKPQQRHQKGHSLSIVFLEDNSHAVPSDKAMTTYPEKQRNKGLEKIAATAVNVLRKGLALAYTATQPHSRRATIKPLRDKDLRAIRDGSTPLRRYKLFYRSCRGNDLHRGYVRAALPYSRPTSHHPPSTRILS